MLFDVFALSNSVGTAALRYSDVRMRRAGALPGWATRRECSDHLKVSHRKTDVAPRTQSKSGVNVARNAIMWNKACKRRSVKRHTQRKTIRAPLVVKNET